MSYTDIAYETSKPWVEEDIPPKILEEMVHWAYPFTAPLISAGGRLVLELFHGPTAAFKDFGARFMARAFSYLRRGEDRPLTILTATSGDTGGAVADGFFNIEGISVIVLYPKGRISTLQEKQIAGLGHNISAISVEGSFDDCQRLVKEAFADHDLKKRLALASANSINVSRLIPQAVYYAAAAGRIYNGLTDPHAEATPRRSGFPETGISTSREPAVFSVPSGNFGNLTAGLYAYKMGAPINKFIAATNVNRTVPDYLEKGYYEARQSQATISNAMDVGAPSNFERMSCHFSWEELKHLILGASVSDEETRQTVSAIYDCGYYLDPHTAVAWKAADKLEKSGALKKAAILSSAHPAKFAETLEPLIGPLSLPPALEKVMGRNVEAKTIPSEFRALKDLLLNY
jgi:threonine synthase